MKATVIWQYNVDLHRPFAIHENVRGKQKYTQAWSMSGKQNSIQNLRKRADSAAIEEGVIGAALSLP